MKAVQLDEGNDSLDLTPMIDVVFLLIVFFLVVAKQVSERYVELEKMSVAKKSQVAENPPNRTIISIDETPEGQKFYWGEQEIDLEQVGICVGKNPDWKVFLRVHPKVTHAVVQDTLRAIGNAGQVDVIFATWMSPG
tara:strand:- start:162 stop:572 length:411 start_codon:yes stop_codon:yes gene_type:complete